MWDRKKRSTMKPYSMDLRERIVSAVQEGGSIRKVAGRFSVGKNFVQKMVMQMRTKGHLLPGKQGGSAVSPVLPYQDQLLAIYKDKPDAILKEYCELFADKTGLWVSQATMCRTFQKLNLPLKKKRAAVAKPRQNEFNC
jgi:transposase